MILDKQFKREYLAVPKNGGAGVTSGVRGSVQTDAPGWTPNNALNQSGGKASHPV
ncbi:hypothetical protein L914_05480 [Phytophthora nicotianae]|uniref:Uncharacterized protein n=1 Tax=Phytophthora nicotianae TaxID=4792 RepID=W2NRA6_PHYNI|nr:hypothetical protein L914_05480 [Phytophthora nicotianae]